MKKSMILSATLNNCIGKDNQLLFKAPPDMWWFYSKTVNKAVIMGRKTFESIGKALPDRINLVASRSDFKHPDVVVYDDIEDMFTLSSMYSGRDCVVIGGGEIYRKALPFVDRIYLTRVQTVVEGDTYIDANFTDGFTMRSETVLTYDDLDYHFQIWDRVPV